MASSQSNSRDSSITLSGGSYLLFGTDESTRADVRDAEALLLLRRLLLEDEAVQVRLDAVIELRVQATAEDHAAYSAALAGLSADLDGHLSVGELDRLAAKGYDRPPLVMLRSGHDRPRARTPSDQTMRIVAAALVMRAEGHSWAEAHDFAAGDKPAHFVGEYRRRLRDTLSRRDPDGRTNWRSDVLGVVQL